MPKTFKNLADLEKYLKKEIDSVLKDDVIDAVRDAQQRAIQEVVYDSYVPEIYERRERDGGLQDSSNMVGSVDDGVLIVENITPFNEDYGMSKFAPSSLTELVIRGGKGYLYNGDFRRPRDFLTKTVKILEENQAVQKTIKFSLKRRGIDANIK
jgi:hypothetical protein